MLSLEPLLFGASAVLLVAVLASKASDRLGIPALLLFLAIGMLVGSEGLGGIEFDDPEAAQTLGTIALAYILFAGGFDTRWPNVRGVAGKALSLATVGVLITAVLLGAMAKLLIGISWLEGMLLGSIVSSTDAAAVFSVLRSRGSNLRGELRPLLELESGSNDPMAVFLTVGVIELMTSRDATVASLVPLFLRQMGIGALFGFVLGRAGARLINTVDFGYEGLYPVLTLGLVLLVYSSTAWATGSGFLAVYIAGIVLGNGPLIHHQSLLRFHDGIAWLMQIAMFTTLGLLAFPSGLLAAVGTGTLLSFLLIFIARPVSVFVSLAFSRMTFREKLLISWVGLRGSVPIILATFPLVAGVDQAQAIFNVVFFIVLLSVAVQGPTLAFMADWLGLSKPFKKKRQAALELSPTVGSNMSIQAMRIPADSPLDGARVVDLGLPEGVLLVLLNRDGAYLVPGGNTAIASGDELTVAASDSQMAEVRRLLGGSATR